MPDDEPARGPGPGPPSISATLTGLEHPGARRRFRPARAGDTADPGLVSVADLLDPAAVARRRVADPVATLGIEELTGSMAFHAVAAPLVDLAVGALVTADVVLEAIPGELLLRVEGVGAVEVVVPAEATVAPAAAADGPAAVADWLVRALDPLVPLVAPVDEALRWGAVADLAVVLALGRQRAQALPVDRTWARAIAVVAELRARRPHPGTGPTRLAVPGPDGVELALARRSTCCQWHRAARHLGEPSVADARCADCPSLDEAVNVARLTALAAAGDLAAP